MNTPDGLTLLAGGARCGKSDIAVRLAAAWRGLVTFVATALVDDDPDFARRIELHRAERPPSWTTVEAPRDAAAAVAAAEPDHLIVVDCVSVLVSNLMLDGLVEADATTEADRLADALVTRSAPALVVTNEVGLGVHPATAVGRAYRDVLGRFNRQLCSRADQAVFVVAGRVLPLTAPEELFR